MIPHDLKIRSIQTTLVNVPMRRALGTSAMRIDHAPMLLVDFITEEGMVGHVTSHANQHHFQRLVEPFEDLAQGAVD